MKSQTAEAETTKAEPAAKPTETTATVAPPPKEMVILNDNSLWARGENSEGQLGDGTKIDKDVFYKNSRRCLLCRSLWL
jgi:hypothetical protein